MSTSMNDFNAQIIEEFRANEGQVGGPFEGGTLLLLHHVGARTGTPRVNPLMYRRDGDRYVVSGQKIWISTAQVATKVLLLARTAPAGSDGQ